MLAVEIRSFLSRWENRGEKEKRAAFGKMFARGLEARELGGRRSHGQGFSGVKGDATVPTRVGQVLYPRAYDERLVSSQNT